MIQRCAKWLRKLVWACMVAGPGDKRVLTRLPADPRGPDAGAFFDGRPPTMRVRISHTALCICAAELPQLSAATRRALYTMGKTSLAPCRCGRVWHVDGDDYVHEPPARQHELEQSA